MATTLSFLLYAVVVIAIGVWAARRSLDTASDIHLAGRDHGTWTSALSASASTESGFLLLGMVGMGYGVGANALWIVPAGIFGYALNWVVLAPRLREKSEALDALTVPEFIAASTGGGRTSRIAGFVAAVLGFAFLVAYVAAQFSAAGKALSTQFEFSYLTAVGLSAGLVAAYALLGGFRAVSWTDNLQAIMMALALLVLPVLVIVRAGGIGEVWTQLATLDATLVSFTAGATGINGVALAVLPWLMLGLAYPGQPHAVARLMAARDASVFRGAWAIATGWFVLTYTGAVALGMSARAAFSDVGAIAADPETTLPVLAEAFLPGVIAGVVLAAILAAITSTADSTLLSAATTLVRDGRAALGQSGRERFWMRVAIVAITALAILFALDESPVVFTLVLYAWAGLGASLGPVVLYCALVRQPRAPAALAGLLVGGLLILLLRDHALNLLIGFAASAASIAVAHAVSPKMSESEKNDAAHNASPSHEIA